jgi:hypothetical protein
MNNKTTTPRIPKEAWEKSQQLALQLSVAEGKRVCAGEANRRAVELAVRNSELMIQDAISKRRKQ